LLEGLCWVDEVRFASPTTGIVFFAASPVAGYSPFEHADRCGISVPPYERARTPIGRLLTDVLATLGLERTDVIADA
jgi:hypothetical protein